MEKGNKNYYISKRVGYLLTFVAGILGVYTYKITNGIFANGLTGDILYISINVANKNIFKATIYLLVVIFFTIGVIIGQGFRYYNKNDNTLYKHNILITEFFLLLIPLFFDNAFLNLFTVSIVFGTQIEVYEYIGDHVFSSVNYVGNTKNAGENLASFIFTHEKKFLYASLKYYLAFVAFFLGGFLENVLYDDNSKFSILICIVVLLFTNSYLYYQHRFKKKNNH